MMFTKIFIYFFMIFYQRIIEIMFLNLLYYEILKKLRNLLKKKKN